MKSMLVIVKVLLLLGCTTTKNKALAEFVKEDQPVIQQKWQDLFKATFEQHKAVKGIGLFSYSGWSDRGQRFILIDATNHSELFVGKANSQKIAASVKLKAEATPDLLALISEAFTLESFDSHAMDGVQYELVILEAVQEQTKVVKRVFMNNPAVSQKGKKHGELVEQLISMDPLVKMDHE